MSRTNRNRPSNQRKGQYPRRITVRSTRRNPPDLHKLARALLDLAAAQAEAEAKAEETNRPSGPSDNTAKGTLPKESDTSAASDTSSTGDAG